MPSRSGELLFYKNTLMDVLRAQNASVAAKVDAIPRNQFLATSDDDLIDHVVSSMAIEPLVFCEENMVMEEEEIKFDIGDKSLGRYDDGPLLVSGVRVTVSIPFSGDLLLWNLRSNPGILTCPRARVRHPQARVPGYLDIIIERRSEEDPAVFKREIDKTLDDVRFCLAKQKVQLDNYHSEIPRLVGEAINNRRQRLKKHDGIAAFLDIPLKHRADAPTIEPIAVKRKLVRPLPPPPEGGYRPEPGIADKEYEHILNVIRHEGRTFETTPTTFAPHNEEGLRDFLLAHLNGHYEGGATGETFRRLGKTDIRIEDKERAAFVAECKIWRGPKEFSDAIDQLLGYLTWRDCKAALVVFNKYNAKFSEILIKAPEVLTGHPNYKKDLASKGEGEWRYVFRSREDELRQIIVHVFLFNLYVKA